MGNFRGRKLLQIGEKYDFRGENFCGLLVFAAPNNVTSPNFVMKTFANSHKTMKFVKVCSLESFPLYSSKYLLKTFLDELCEPSSPYHYWLWTWLKLTNMAYISYKASETTMYIHVQEGSINSFWPILSCWWYGSNIHIPSLVRLHNPSAVAVSEGDVCSR